MQHLDNLWKLMSVASTVRDFTSDNKTLSYRVGKAPTLYIHIESGKVRISRHHQPEVTIHIQIQPTFAWRTQTEQDDAGVYLVAKPRRGFTGISTGLFEIMAPFDTYFIIKAEQGQLILNNFNETLHITPDNHIQAIHK